MDNGMNNIKSDEITISSSLKIKFLCPYCLYGEHGEWVASPNGRAAEGHKTGCPRCRYNWYKAETGQTQNIKSQYRKSETPSKPKPFKIVELSDIDKEMQSWDF